MKEAFRLLWEEGGSRNDREVPSCSCKKSDDKKFFLIRRVKFRNDSSNDLWRIENFNVSNTNKQVEN